MVLTSDWSDFEEDMTCKDLHDLGEVEFLLWYQNVQIPKPKKKDNNSSSSSSSSTNSSTNSRNKKK